MGELTLGRLLVADHGASNAWLFDLDEEEPALLETFSLSSPARAYAGLHGRYGYLVQREANEVRVLDSGIVFESHVDHYHVMKGAPQMLDLTLEGSAPTHFVHHEGWVASFYDGSGDVDVLQERTISAGSPSVRTAATGVAHHGVAVVTMAHLLATVGTEGDSLPSEVGIWPIDALDAEPEMLAGPCPRLHGEAAAGDFVLFGCADGVLAVERHDDHFDVSKLDNPPGTPDGTRIGRLVAHEDLPVVFGNWGSEGFALIDPEGGTITPVSTDEPVVTFGLDMHGEHLYALTADGLLHRFEAADATPAGEPMEVSGSIDLSGGHGAARPSLAPGAGRMYVALPDAGEVLEIHGADWEVERRISLDGVPHSLAVVSASPDWHESGHEDHDHGP
jgi:hypothetical protein